MEPDYEAQARMETARATRYRAALVQLVQAVEAMPEESLPWVVLAAVHEGKAAVRA